jgi:hypothetical protein
MIQRIVAVFALAALIATTPTTSGTPVPPFSSLVRWTMATGQGYTMPGFIAAPLGLGSSDIIVRQNGFFDETDHLTRFVRAFTQGGETKVVFVKYTSPTDPTKSLLWLTDESGSLLATVYYDQYTTPRAVPNADYAHVFDDEKSYWLRKVPAYYIH